MKIDRSQIQSVISSLGVQSDLHSQLVNSTTQVKGQEVIDSFSRLAPKDVRSLLSSPPAEPAAVSDPSAAFQREGLIGKYPANEMLSQEKLSVDRMTAHLGTDAYGKEDDALMKLPDEGQKQISFSPADLELKILNDAAFRKSLEQRLGGNIILEGNLELDIAVEKAPTRPVAAPAVSNVFQGMLPAAAHLNRIEGSFAHVVAGLIGETTPGKNSAPELLNRFTDLTLNKFFPSSEQLAQAQLDLDSGKISGFLGGASGKMSGVLTSYVIDATIEPSADHFRAPMEEIEKNVRNMQVVLRETIDVFDQTQKTLGGLEVKA